MTKQLNRTTLEALHHRADDVLKELVTDDGVYASAQNGWKGPYHSWFGRDGAITAELIGAAVPFGGNCTLAMDALQSLLAFSRFQGSKNNPETGEEIGKMPHEIRTTFDSVDQVQHAARTNAKPWYVDPTDGIMKNWDSVDSTPLWIIAVIRLHDVLQSPLDRYTKECVKAGMDWIVDNMNHNEGFVGFIGADDADGRVYSGLHNQGWKDSEKIYQYEDGSLATHPIKDVLVNAESWAALRLGAEVWKSDDEKYSRKINGVAMLLRHRFNMSRFGFLLPTKDYYAQALDAEGTQLPHIAADVPMSMWAYYRDECVIGQSYLEKVIERTMKSSMLNPAAGIRNYEEGTIFRQKGTHYHGTSSTYWPFVSAFVSRGMLHFGHDDYARQIMNASLSAVHELGSNIELFVCRQDGHVRPWHHPELGQQSAREQAWTAASVYFETLYLLAHR